SKTFYGSLIMKERAFYRFEVFDEHCDFVARTADRELAKLVVPEGGAVFDCSKTVMTRPDGGLRIVEIKDELLFEE
ncbi:MAG: hypothetical protein IJO46_09560, partial [Thermoguttaceae bacterium]|nr:hypothetical protein [Thermoguttaceae bacterium]